MVKDSAGCDLEFGSRIVDPSHEVLAKLVEIKGTFDFHSATTKYEESLLIGSLDKSTLKLNKACVI